MAFTPAVGRAADGIGNIVVTLKDAVEVTGDDPQDAYQSAHFELIIEYDDDSTKHRRGDLVPHLEVEERDWLMDLMDTLRARAVAQILPP